MKDFSERIRSERNRIKKRQADVAEYIGTSIQNYSAYENNTEPSYALLCKLADYFRCTTDYLLGRTDERKGQPVEIKPDAAKAIQKMSKGGVKVVSIDTINSKIIFLLPYSETEHIVIITTSSADDQIAEFVSEVNYELKQMCEHLNDCILQEKT